MDDGQVEREIDGFEWRRDELPAQRGKAALGVQNFEVYASFVWRWKRAKSAETHLKGRTALTNGDYALAQRLETRMFARINQSNMRGYPGRHDWIPGAPKGFDLVQLRPTRKQHRMVAARHALVRHGVTAASTQRC